MSQDAIPKLPSPEILNKNLASANVMTLQVKLAGNPMDMMDFLWVEMHQPSHLKGTWEIPMSKIPVTTTMTKELQITTHFCKCTRQDYAQFQYVQSNKHHRNFSGQNAGGDGHQVQMVDQCHLINPVKAPKHEAGDLHHQRSASPDWDG